MPRINGEEFIGRFRAMPHSAAVPIMMITVNDQRMLRLRALESGATDFLTTPIDHYEFLSRARNLLKLSKSAGTEKQTIPKESPQATPAPAAKGTQESLSVEASQFRAPCGAANAYALHVVEIGESGREPFDPAVVVAALRRQLRGDDLVARIDRRRFAVLQKNVVDPADANACARRLSSSPAAGGVVKVGTSLPRGDAGAPGESAAARLREAAVLAHAAPANTDAGLAAPENSNDPWRFQPRIDLRSGAVVGAQTLRGADPADADDSQALRAALACASALRKVSEFSGHPSCHLSLRLRLKQNHTAPLALLVAPLLAGTRVPPSWLDLRICAREALEQRAQAEAQAQALKALGIGLTLELRSLQPLRLRGDEAEALHSFVESWRPTILFPCGNEGAEALARLLGLRAAGRAPLLLADGVASAALLKPLLRAGVSLAQGSCFGTPFPARDFQALLASGRRIDAGSHLAARHA
jgi:EAL domain-containing protein (putative c-di-GMP-specific phosphodiesterase class I)